jgi:hypothetical protein
LSAVLDQIDVVELPGFELVEVLVACARQVAHAEARLLEVLAEFAHRRADPWPVADSASTARHPARGSEFAADEVGAALATSRVAAGHRLVLAVDLVERLPATLTALRAGRIDLQRARVIAEETAVLVDARDPASSAARLARVEERVPGRAWTQTPARLRASRRRAVMAADPSAADARHNAAKAARKMVVYPLPDGIAELRWTDTVDRVLGLSAALDGLARAARAQQGRAEFSGSEKTGPARTMDQVRADVLAELGARLLADPRLPSTQGARPHIAVVMPLGTALGLAPAITTEGGADGSPEPAELDGYGPIPAALARALAADGTWTRWLTDPVSGALLDLGRARYRPTAAIREVVLARDRTCQGGDGCRVSARRCDIDHTVDWTHGGVTAAASAAALCRHTHRAKHEGGWSVARDGDELRWTTPTGAPVPAPPGSAAGAVPPGPLTRRQRVKIRAHARAIGIDHDLLTHSGPSAGSAAPERSATSEKQHSPDVDIPPF